jgi:DNA repair protein RecO (recombination protein O)
MAKPQLLHPQDLQRGRVGETVPVMDWRDEGVILALRPHGENAAIIEIFTRAHGRHAGVVRGGASRRLAPHLQPGTQVAATWTARLSDHLGTFAVEPLQSRAHVMQDRFALAGLASVCALLVRCLPERAPQVALWQETMAALDALGSVDWPAIYLRWELRLLEELGFGLDLSACAVTGAREGLAFVSPKTGRAVSRAGAGDWADRLFPLPEGLVGSGSLSPQAVVQGLAITGHFLTRALAETGVDQGLPQARGRLVDLLSR